MISSKLVYHCPPSKQISLYDMESRAALTLLACQALSGCLPCVTVREFLSDPTFVLSSIKPEQHYRLRFAMSALEGNNDSSSGAVPSEAVNAPESIAAARVLCTNSFNRLIELLRDPDRSRKSECYIPTELVESQLERFKLWEAKIRDVQHVSQSPSEAKKAKERSAVMKKLRDLNHLLTECKCMSRDLRGEK